MAKLPERLTPEMEQAWRTLRRECVRQGNDPCPVFWAADVRRWCCGCIGQRLLAEIDALRAERLQVYQENAAQAKAIADLRGSVADLHGTVAWRERERDDLIAQRDALASTANGLEADREYNAALAEELRAERDAYKAALADSRRLHYHCDDYWYCCGACTHPDHGELDSHAGEAARTAGVCNCGAAEWNRRVDGALARDERS